MTLNYTGETHTTLNSTIYRAIGSSGELIIVEASHEAVQDYGAASVQQKGSTKYDTGDVVKNKVIVRTTDFP